MKKIALIIFIATMLMAGCTNKGVTSNKMNDEDQKAKKAVEQALKTTEQYIEVLQDGNKNNIRDYSEIYSTVVEVDCAIVQSTKFDDQCNTFRTLSKYAKDIKLSKTNQEMSEAIKIFLTDAENFLSHGDEVLAR